MQVSKLSKTQMLEHQRRFGHDGRVAKVLGVTRQAVFQRRKALGIPSKRSRNPQRDAMIRKLYGKGKTVRELVAKFALSFSQVYRIIR